MQIKRMNDPSGTAVSIDLPVEKDSYVQRILTENEIPGLCRLRIKNTDGERRYCFQTGRMRSLQEAAEKGTFGAETLRMVLESLAALREELEEYLMGTDCLLLDPELIFLAEEGQVRFCACPGQQPVPGEGLPGLIEWFCGALADLSESDGLSEQQREGLRALCAESEPDPGKMRALLQTPETEEAQDPQEERERRAALPGWVKKHRREAAHRERRRKTFYRMGRIGSLLTPLAGIGVELLLWKSGILAGFSRWIRAGIHGVAALFFLMLTLLLLESGERRMIDREEALEILPPPEEEELPQIQIEDTLEYDADELEAAAGVLERGETVLLSELMIAGSALGILISRQPERRPNIYVTASPFHIGKAGSGADAEPESSYLSREHAVIEAAETGCRLRDEGSTNGTFVNGDRLIPGQWTLLSDGDELRFADAPYRYRQGCRED